METATISATAYSTILTTSSLPIQGTPKSPAISITYSTIRAKMDALPKKVDTGLGLPHPQGQRDHAEGEKHESAR